MYAVFDKTGKEPCHKWHEKINILIIAAKKSLFAKWDIAKDKESTKTKKTMNSGNET